MKSLVSLVKVFKKTNSCHFVHFVVILLLLGACKEEQKDGKKPAALTETSVKATPIHGGAVISYSIPDDPDILYVMAEYVRNGKSFTERSSVYDNYLTIEGFNTTEPVSATLYTVRRNSDVKSDPVTVTFTPLEGVVALARKSTEIMEGFGGIVATWENITRTELGVRLQVDSLGTLLEKEMLFSSLLTQRYAFRGFDRVETTFIITYEDKWGNISEPLYFTGTPMYETEVPKPWIDRRGTFLYDNVTGNFNYVWDNSLTGRYLSENNSTGSSFTFDFGRVVKLSRMAMWPADLRSFPYPAWNAVYAQIHILEFEMWGTKAIDYSKTGNQSYWLHPFSAAQNGLPLPWQHPFSALTPAEIEAIPGDNFAKDWVYLGHYKVTRLDLLGASDDDIWAQGAAGWHFDLPLDAAPVSVIRFFPIATIYAGVLSTPPTNNYWAVGELSFWGDDTVPQE